MVDKDEVRELAKAAASTIFYALERYGNDEGGAVIEIATDQDIYEIDLGNFARNTQVYRGAEWIAKDTVLKRVQTDHYLKAIDVFNLVLGDERISA